jgi:hypothetical protein
VVTRASTLATEAITPSFTSSVIQIRLSVTPSLYRVALLWDESARESGGRLQLDAIKIAPSAGIAGRRKMDAWRCEA